MPDPVSPDIKWAPPWGLIESPGDELVKELRKELSEYPHPAQAQAGCRREAH